MPSSRRRSSSQVQLDIPRSRSGSLHLHGQRCNSLQGMLYKRRSQVHTSARGGNALLVCAGRQGLWRVRSRVSFLTHLVCVWSSLPFLDELHLSLLHGCFCASPPRFGRSGRVLRADTYGRGKVSIGSFCNAYFCTAVHPFNPHRCCVQLSLVYVQTCREHDDLPFCIRLDTARSRFEVAVVRAENTSCVSYAPAGRRVVVCAMSTAVGIDRLRMCLLRAYGCCRGDDSEASAGHPICLLRER